MEINELKETRRVSQEVRVKWEGTIQTKRQIIFPQEYSCNVLCNFGEKHCRRFPLNKKVQNAISRFPPAYNHKVDTGKWPRRISHTRKLGKELFLLLAPDWPLSKTLFPHQKLLSEMEGSERRPFMIFLKT